MKTTLGRSDLIISVLSFPDRPAHEAAPAAANAPAAYAADFINSRLEIWVGSFFIEIKVTLFDEEENAETWGHGDRKQGYRDHITLCPTLSSSGLLAFRLSGFLVA